MIRNDLGTVRRGFAFIDMVVAIALTTVLVGLTVPAMEAARQKAAQMDSAENLKKIAVGLHAAHDAHKRLPPAVGFYPMLNVPDKYLEKQPAAHGTVFFHILPFIKQEKVWKDSKGMSHDTKAVIDLYYSEADPSLPPSHKIPDGQGAVSFAANGYVLGGGTYSKDGEGWGGGVKKEGAFFSRRTLPQVIALDGSANTIAFAERFARCIAKGEGGKQVDYQRAWSEDSKHFTPFTPVVWNDKLLPQFGATMKADAAPKGSVPCNPEAFQAFGKTINVVMFDGSLKRVSSKVGQKSWSYAMRDDDGFVPGEDF